MNKTKTIIKWLWIFLIKIGLEGSLLPLTELHVHRANFAREVNKSHVAVSTYPNIVTGENQYWLISINLIGRHFEPQPIRGGLANELR